MIGRISQDKSTASQVELQEEPSIKLGDLMRGERATMGKSLLDVHRELRIKASYIAAIENCDPSEFDSPSFIAGYVRSYARYLGMDPDEAFAGFCAESGFEVAHGMSSQASTIRRPQTAASASAPRNSLADPRLPIAPIGDSWTSRIEPAAVASSAVLLALIAGIGYGGWTVLKEIQRVQVVPVDQTPAVLSQLDPLDGVRTETTGSPIDLAQAASQSPAAFDRLYRPQALDVPVLVSRDAPISTLDPATVGIFSGVASNAVTPNQDSELRYVQVPSAPAIPEAPQAPETATSSIAEQIEQLRLAELPQPQVLQNNLPGVTIVATAETWVEVTAPSGKRLFAQVLQKGQTYNVPATEKAPKIFSGNAGGVYFAVNGQTYGPYGKSGKFGRGLELDAQSVTSKMQVADLSKNTTLRQVVAELNLKAAGQ